MNEQIIGREEEEILPNGRRVYFPNKYIVGKTPEQIFEEFKELTLPRSLIDFFYEISEDNNIKLC